MQTDRGSQSLELAMAVPAVLLVALVVVALAQVGVGVMGAHHLAATTARLAAVADDEVVHRLAADAGAHVTVHPVSGVRRPGDLVHIEVQRDIAVVLIGRHLTIAASATALTEDIP